MKKAKKVTKKVVKNTKVPKVVPVETKQPLTLVFHSPETPIKDKKRATIVGIVDDKLSTIDIGVAVCSVRDEFRKKMGKTIAEGRAQKDRSRFCSIIIKDKAKTKETFYEFAAKLSNSL